MPAGSHLSPSANNRQPHDPDCCVLGSFPPSPHNTHTHTSRRPSTSIQLDLHTTHTGPAPQQARRGPSTTPQQDAAPRPRQQARRSSSTTPPASQDVSSSDATRNKIDVTDFLGRGSLNAAAASTTRSQSGSSLLSHRYPFITHSLHSSSAGSILAKLLNTSLHKIFCAHASPRAQVLAMGQWP